MTLRLSEDGTVVAALIPEPFRGVLDGVAFPSVDRKKGLLLRSIRSPLPEQLVGLARTRLKGHHAA